MGHLGHVPRPRCCRSRWRNHLGAPAPMGRSPALRIMSSSLPTTPLWCDTLAYTSAILSAPASAPRPSFAETIGLERPPLRRPYRRAESRRRRTTRQLRPHRDCRAGIDDINARSSRSRSRKASHSGDRPRARGAAPRRPGRLRRCDHEPRDFSAKIHASVPARRRLAFAARAAAPSAFRTSHRVVGGACGPSEQRSQNRPRPAYRAGSSLVALLAGAVALQLLTLAWCTSPAPTRLDRREEEPDRKPRTPLGPA